MRHLEHVGKSGVISSPELEVNKIKKNGKSDYNSLIYMEPSFNCCDIRLAWNKSSTRKISKLVENFFVEIGIFQWLYKISKCEFFTILTVKSSRDKETSSFSQKTKKARTSTIFDSRWSWFKLKTRNCWTRPCHGIRVSLGHTT